MGRGGEKGWFYKALAAGWWWLGHLTPFDSIGRARYGNEWGGEKGGGLQRVVLGVVTGDYIGALLQHFFPLSLWSFSLILAIHWTLIVTR